MNFDDVVYLICLLSCIGFGYFMRTIKDDSQKKLMGTGFGVLMVFIVSGWHILHPLISFGICALTIHNAHPSKCHVFSFAIMFTYLAFFRTTTFFGIPPVPGHTNLIQMILTLKVAGLAFEKSAAYRKIELRKKQIEERNQPSTSEKKDLEPLVELTDYDMELQNISILEMFHYSFNYIGVLTGPYYRYRTFRDYFEMPFKTYANGVEVTIQKLQYVAVFAVIYLISNYLWPLEYSLSDAFNERSFFYRAFFVIPYFIVFRMRIFIGIILSECICICSGFGAYPDDCDVLNGEGPKKQYLHLKRDAEKKTYNFITVNNLRIYDFETCLTVRDGMKTWNVCVQYWLAVYIYKMFPSKKYRQHATLLVSSFWHGFQPGHYLCIMGALAFVPAEDLYIKLYRKDATGTKKQIVDGLLWLSKSYALAFLGTTFSLLTFENIWRYYTSTYFFGCVYVAVMMAIGLIIANKRKLEEKKQKRALEKNEGVSGQKEKAQ